MSFLFLAAALSLTQAQDTPALLAQAGSPKTAVRREALKVLASEYQKRGLGQEALPVLKKALSDKDRYAREHAAAALGGIASLVYIASHSAAGTAYGRKVETDFQKEPGLDAALMRALADRQPEVRRHAAVALGFAYPPRADIEEAFLARWKVEKAAPVRGDILLALGKARYASPRVRTLLEKALKDRDPKIRRRAEEALRLIKG